MSGVMTLQGQFTQTNIFSEVNLPLPDADLAGIQDVRHVVSDIHEITSVRVRLKVTGEFNGDLYGYVRYRNGGLTHICVLLNRPGRTSSNQYGYADSGMEVTFADLASTDIHTYRDAITPPTGTPLAGSWQPDARFVDPMTATTTSPRTVFLSEFNGLNAGGEWTLFLADADQGATNFLNGWGLEITGKAMPEIVWTNPAAIVYGATLGAEQLNATANVPGTFTYTPPAGTILTANNSHWLSVTFVPDDTDSYVQAAASVTQQVLPQTLTITAGNTNKTYGNTLMFAGTEFTATGLLNGDIVTNVTLLSAGTVAPAPTGNYEVVPIEAAGQGLGNYTIHYEAGTLVVGPAALLVHADEASRPYGQTNPAFTASFTGLVNGEVASVLDGELVFHTLAETNSPVGEYAIEPGGLTATNYTLTYSNGTLTITVAALTVGADPVFRAYGETNPPLTGTLIGVQNGENITATFQTPAETSSPAGEYPITPALNDLDGKLVNYSVSTNLGTLTVIPAALLVKADDSSRAYGQTNPIFTAAISGFVNGEDASVLGGELGFQTLAETNSPVGNYAIEPGGLSATNYALTFSNGTLTVTAVNLRISADAVTRSYGATNPPLTGTLAGVQNGDNLTAIFQTAADTNSPVGDYLIFPVWQDPDGKLGNYAVLTNFGTLTVTAAALLVQADDCTRAYGRTNPVFTASLSGWVNGEDASVLGGELLLGTAADTNSPPGKYTIESSGLMATNYALTFSNGALTVTVADLTVSADSVFRPYGTTNPPLTGTLTGVQNGERITVTFHTVAVTDSPVGEHPITPAFDDPDGKLVNYTVSTNLGTLNITQAVTVAVLGSSANPALLGSWVTLSVGLSPLPPSTGVPTGTVQFKVDGADFETPVRLVEGQGSLNSVAIPAGHHLISVEYSGDANFLGTTAELGTMQIINTPPVIMDDVVTRVATQGAKVPVSVLLANDSDADGDTVAFDGAALTSTAGGTIGQTNGWLFYTPPPDFTSNDSFAYTVRDSHGGCATGAVTLAVLPDRGTAARLNLFDLGGGHFRVISDGVPWGNYLIEFTETPQDPSWRMLAVGTADPSGELRAEDAALAGPGARFYRSVYQEGGDVSLPFCLSVVSSTNPAPPGTTVALVARLAKFSGGDAAPSGTVQFQIDGMAYGSPVGVQEGGASLVTSSLAWGEHTVCAEYSGDDHYRSATCLFGFFQVMNNVPVALGDVIQRNPTHGTKYLLNDLLANDSDADGEALTLDAISAATVEGGSLSLAEGWIFYTPPVGFVNADAFTYRVRDSLGATATATVEIAPRVGYEPSANLSIVDLGDGNYHLIFSGVPWRVYNIQYAESLEHPNWQSVATRTADTQGRFEYDDVLPSGTPSRYYRSISDSGAVTASPFRQTVWTNFIAHTNGRSMVMWTERTLPPGWPDTPPVMAWNTNCLLYGLEGFTAISQCNEFQMAPGQIPVTLLTRRHAYVRGHSMGENGLHTYLAGKRVWFCSADNTVVQMTVAAEFIRVDYTAGYDYGILIFTEDVPPSISPVFVMSPADREIYYANTPDLPYLFLGPEQFGNCAAVVPPFVYSIYKGGDSGSPNLIPSPDNKLIMFSGRGTSGLSPQMQADMDFLSLHEGLDPARYQMRRFDWSPWAP